VVGVLVMTASAVAVAAQVQTTKPGEPVERQLSGDQTIREWTHDPNRLEGERGDRLEVRQVAGEEVGNGKLKDVGPPIRFESGVAQIPPSYVGKLAEILEGMRSRKNVRLHFVGHTDSQSLSPALARVFTDNAGLSKARAGEVAEYFKTALGLPPEAI